MSLVLSRRAVLIPLGVAVSSYVVGCSGRSGRNAGESSSNGAGKSGSPSPRPGETSTWRPVTDIQVVPDTQPRNVQPTSPSGDPVEVHGLTLTAPADATVSEVSNSEGNPATEILMPGAYNGVPRVRVRRVESFGRPLVDETYTQEMLLVSERQTNVFRTKETWPHMKEAYIITWDTSVSNSDGSNLPLSALGFWLGDTETSGWTLIATAEQGKLENSPLWDVTFSARSA